MFYASNRATFLWKEAQSTTLEWISRLGKEYCTAFADWMSLLESSSRRDRSPSTLFFRMKPTTFLVWEEAASLQNLSLQTRLRSSEQLIIRVPDLSGKGNAVTSWLAGYCKCLDGPNAHPLLAWLRLVTHTIWSLNTFYFVHQIVHEITKVNWAFCPCQN